MRYALSWGLLLIPVFIWNVVFVGHLPAELSPAEFGRDIPSWLGYVENVARFMVLALPLFMPLERPSSLQRRGWAGDGGAALVLGPLVSLVGVSRPKRRVRHGPCEAHGHCV